MARKLRVQMITAPHPPLPKYMDYDNIFSEGFYVDLSGVYRGVIPFSRIPDIEIFGSTLEELKHAFKIAVSIFRSEQRHGSIFGA